MKREFLSAVLIAGAFAAATFGAAGSAEAGSIQITSDSGYTGSNGAGEFGVTTYSGGAAVPSMGSGVAISGSVFQTFCLESNESMVFGKTIDFTSGTSATDGGLSGGNPDPLDARTAYLYTQFWDGNLTDYDYTTGSGRTDSATSLQLAIWNLEGELSSSLQTIYDANSQAQTWVALANSAVDDGDWSGIGDVRILNLTDGDTKVQSVLTREDTGVTPIPLPPASLLGLGLMGGLGGAGLLRRRYRRDLA